MITLQKLISLLAPPHPNFHYNKKYLKNLVIESTKLKYPILDLGSGGRSLGEGVISLDIHKSGTNQIIADAAALPFKANSFKFVVSTAVLEHVYDLNAALSEIFRCCSPGGKVYIEVPFLQTYHAHPQDFRRFTLKGLELIMSDYCKIDSGVCVGPFSVLAWYFRKLPNFLCKNKAVGLAFEFIAGWLTFWIKYFDAFWPGARHAHQVASGLFFYGVKKPQ